MSALQTTERLKGYEQDSLDTLLLKLCHLGSPAVSKMRDGWWARLDMHVSAAGTTFRVDSEMNCKTPIEAVRQCTERSLTVLNQWQ